MRRASSSRRCRGWRPRPRRAGPPGHARPSGEAVESRPGGGDRADAGPAAARSGRRRWPAGRSRSTWTPPTWRSTAARSAAWRITTRASGSAGRTWRPGPRPRSCWPLTWATAPMTRARPRRACCAAPWHACPRRPGPGGWRCAPTPGTSPGSWPAPPTTRASPSRSAPSGSRRCGGCWPASPTTTGTTPSRWTVPRSRSRSTARTGGRRTPGCWSAGWRWTRPRSPPTPGHGAAGRCTRTSAPCRSPSWRSSPPSTPTRSS